MHPCHGRLPHTFYLLLYGHSIYDASVPRAQAISVVVHRRYPLPMCYTVTAGSTPPRRPLHLRGPAEHLLSQWRAYCMYCMKMQHENADALSLEQQMCIDVY